MYLTRKKKHLIEKSLQKKYQYVVQSTHISIVRTYHSYEVAASGIGIKCQQA